MPYGQKNCNRKKTTRQWGLCHQHPSLGTVTVPSPLQSQKTFQSPDTAYNPMPSWKQSEKPHSHSNRSSRKTGIATLPSTTLRSNGTWPSTSGRSSTAESLKGSGSPRSLAQITQSKSATSQDPAKAASAQYAPKSRWTGGLTI